MKKEIFFGIVLLLAGIATAQFLGSEFLTTYGFLNQYHIQAFLNNRQDTIQMFWNVLWERGKIFFLLLLISFTPLLRYMGTIIKAVIIFTFGFFLWVCILNFGLFGILISLAAVLPHGICYVAAIFWLINLRKPSGYRRIYNVGKGSGRKILIQVLWWGLLFIVIITGSFLEATAGVWLLQNVLRICI